MEAVAGVLFVLLISI